MLIRLEFMGNSLLKLLKMLSIKNILVDLYNIIKQYIIFLIEIINIYTNIKIIIISQQIIIYGQWYLQIIKQSLLRNILYIHWLALIINYHIRIHWSWSFCLKIDKKLESIIFNIIKIKSFSWKIYSKLEEFIIKYGKKYDVITKIIKRH